MGAVRLLFPKGSIIFVPYLPNVKYKYNIFMRWIVLFIPLLCYALEVIINPYDSIQHGDIEVYHYNECVCPEDEIELPQEPFDFDKFILKL
jgi:hypothetical protein